MSYRVVLTREVEKALDRLDRPIERRLRAQMIELSEDPFDPRISGPLTERVGIRKSRVGGWRILYRAERESKALVVLALDTRGQVYRRL